VPEETYAKFACMRKAMKIRNKLFSCYLNWNWVIKHKETTTYQTLLPWESIVEQKNMYKTEVGCHKTWARSKHAEHTPHWCAINLHRTTTHIIEHLLINKLEAIVANVHQSGTIFPEFNNMLTLLEDSKQSHGGLWINVQVGMNERN